MSTLSIDKILERIDDELSSPGVSNLFQICKGYSDMTGIPVETLRRAYYRKVRSKKGTPVRSRLNRTLTDLQEQALVYTCQVFASINLGLKPKELIMIASQTWNLKLTPRWAQSFMKRHKNELTVRRSQSLCKARNTPDVILPAVKTWIDELHIYFQKNYFPPYAMFNFDETRLNFTERGIHFRRIASRQQQKSDLQTNREQGSMTLVSFISASGEVFFSVYIFSEEFQGKSQTEAEFKILHQFKTRTSGWPRYYCFSEKGYLNSDILAAIIAEFCDRWNLLHPGLHSILFSDQLASHRDPIIVALAFEKGIRMYSLPANTSHFLQPCDSFYFAQFKSKLTENHLDRIRANGLLGESMANLLIESAYEAEVEASKERTIKRSWDEVGLSPFQPDKIWKRANNSLGGVIGSECEQIARTAVKVVIDGNRKKKARVVSGRAVVRLNQLFSPESILQAHKELIRNSNQRAEQETCRFPGCRKRSRGGKAWTSCQCGSFRLCSQHKRNQIVCTCIPNSSSSSDTAIVQSSQSTLLTQPTQPADPAHQEQVQTSSLDQPPVCPVCNLLMPNPDECGFCAHPGFASTVQNLETDDDSNSSNSSSEIFDLTHPSETILLNQIELHPTQGICEVCGWTSRNLRNNRCQKPSCQSFKLHEKRIRRPKRIDFE